jgi:5-(aminomethyl)-3-furanmethanol phosphate kinase
MHNVEKNLELELSAYLRIIKLGGSLLTQALLPSRFHVWMADRSTSRNLIVVGGGELVEAVRELDQIHHFDESFVHWLCVDLMHQTALLAQQLLNIDTLCASPDQLLGWNQTWQHFDQDVHPLASTAIVSPNAFYTRETASEQQCPLSESWKTTSDSIAAWLARRLDAHELVLLKSPTDLLGTDGLQFRSPCSNQLNSLADVGLVDSGFPVIAAGLPLVRIESLK